MEQKIVLDTDVIIDHLNNKDHGRLETMITKEGVSIFVSAITVFELSLRTRNLETAKKFLGKLSVLPITNESAQLSAEIEKGLCQKGMILDVSDVLIAGCCIINDCKLMTNNKSHFMRIPNLALV